MTTFPTHPELAAACYSRGRSTGQECDEIAISLRGTWGGKLANGGTSSSCEKIGYHAGSIDFLRGVFDVGTPVYQYQKTIHGFDRVRVWNLEDVRITSGQTIGERLVTDEMKRN